MTDEELDEHQRTFEAQQRLWNLRGWNGHSPVSVKDSQWLAVFDHIESCMRQPEGHTESCECPCHSIWERRVN